MMQDLNEWIDEAGPAIAESVAALFEQHLPTLDDRDKAALAAEFYELSLLT